MRQPERFIGLHFFNPVPMMALLELIRGLQTSDDTHATAVEFAKAIGKTPITVKNGPGFAVNRILCPMINEAIFVLQEGGASAEDIDTGMKLGCNHPIGPLALADLIGLDTLLAVMQVFYEGFNDPKYRPAPLLKEMVAAGRHRPQERARILRLRVTHMSEYTAPLRDMRFVLRELAPLDQVAGCRATKRSRSSSPTRSSRRPASSPRACCRR